MRRHTAASDALKQFKESIVAHADSFSRLIQLNIRGEVIARYEKQESTHGEENIDANKD